LIRQLQGAISQSHLENGRMFEMGGVLLGNVVQSTGGRHEVFVDEYVPVECEHVRGSSWTLSKADKHELGSRLLRLNRQGRDRAKVVGWFRTHTRPGLYLDQHDFKLFQEYFQHPEHVCLLVRPSEDKSPETAGFFFWEDGDIQRAQCYKTFQFPPPLPSRAAEPVAQRARPEPDRKDSAPAVADPMAARSAPPVPPPVRRTDPRGTRWILWVPVALGLLAGVVWSPNPLRKSDSRSPTVRTGERSRERPVFTLPDFPSPSAADPTEVAAVVPEERQASRTDAGRQVRKFEPAPVRSVAVGRPKFVADDVLAPKIAAVRTPAIPSLNFQTAPLLAQVNVEPPKRSAIRRAFGSIPGFGFLKRKKASDGEFTPAKPVRQVRPVSPEELKTEVPVRVRLTVDQSGNIVDAAVLGYADSKLAESALDAAKRWEFEPAKVHDEPVETEVILRFRFAPGNSDI
jgi:TonB family protein